MGWGSAGLEFQHTNREGVTRQVVPNGPGERLVGVRKHAYSGVVIRSIPGFILGHNRMFVQLLKLAKEGQNLSAKRHTLYVGFFDFLPKLGKVEKWPF